MMLDEHFTSEQLASRWTRTTPNSGLLTCANSVLRLALPRASAGRYSDAQIDDYGNLPRRRFPWRPPLRLEVRARASHLQHPPAVSAQPGQPPGITLRGTAGFGFWNYPFSLTGTPLALPEAIWFFYASPPSNMALVPGVSGWGWKAQVIHARRWGAVAASVPALAAMALARATGHERAAAHWLRRVSGATEAHLKPALTAWHDYTLTWRPSEVRFAVDGREVLALSHPPPGPLGFVAWLDNQFAVATPRGVLRFGTLDSGPEWLDLDFVRITPL